MLKLSFRYDQTSARLEVDGLPDISLGHSEETIGIISSWTLQLVGSPELSGKRVHLESMMAAVLPYARHRLSGVKRAFGDEHQPVSISPNESGHKLLLRSSQKGVKPLTVHLDDAELTDLVRCLDALRLDIRVKVSWQIPSYRPLHHKDIADRVPFARRFTAALIGISAFVSVAAIGLLIPIPEGSDLSPIEARLTMPTRKL